MKDGWDCHQFQLLYITSRPNIPTGLHRPMFNIFGQNINFVCGLVDMSLDVQINAKGT